MINPISNNKANGIPVLQYDLEGNFIKEWDSMIQAARELNLIQPSISNCCRGMQKSHRKFQWKYKTDNYPLKIKSLRSNDFDIHRRTKPIICLETGEKFNSIREAAKKLNLFADNISDVLRGVQKTTKNLSFRYL